ncbi:MAG: AsmA family protein [Bryobacteraceae bacterium]
MKTRRKKITRTILVSLACLLALGLLAPFIEANWLKAPIQRTLERSLHREVEIQGGVHFNLFTGPGFAVERVLIHEDPSIGIEPFAFVSSLEARLGISTLWKGRLEFSTLRLVEPDVNLVKAGNGTWNVVLLLNQRSRESGEGGVGWRIPDIQVEAGRLNFKFGDLKSVYYVTSADLFVGPDRWREGTFNVRFSGSPARTDRTAQGFGFLTGDGSWRMDNSSEPVLELDVELEKSAMSEMARLFRGYGYGLHGLIASQAKISGPLSDLRIAGQAQVEDVHRWDLMESRGGVWRLSYSGKLDWPGQRLELAASPVENAGSPLAVRMRVSNLLAQPRLAADVTLRQLPAASVMEVARHMGVPVPHELEVDGKMMGVMGYASSGGMQGQIAIEDSEIQLSGKSHLRLPRAQMLLSGDRIRLLPTAVIGEGGQSAQLEATFVPEGRALDVRVTARSLSIGEVQSGSGHLMRAAALPMVEHFRRGRWSGWLRYQAADEKPEGWSGAFELNDAEAEIPGMAEPFLIRSASVLLRGERVSVSRLRAEVGEIEVRGDYRYIPKNDYPHRFQVSIPAAELVELERVLMPTLRRRKGFLARTFRFGKAPMPAWLETRRAQGTLRIARLTAGDMEFSRVECKAVWEGSDVELVNVKARVREGSISGTAMVDLSRTAPIYTMAGRIEDLAWHEGTVDLDGQVETAGIGGEFLLNLKSEGAFQASAIDLFPDTPVRSASGTYALLMSRTGPRIKLTSLLASLGTEQFSGQGGTQADGRLQLELASASRLLLVTGPLAPLQLDMRSAQIPSVP